MIVSGISVKLTSVISHPYKLHNDIFSEFFLLRQLVFRDMRPHIVHCKQF